MIQRIQSLYLLAASVLSALLLFIPIGEAMLENGKMLAVYVVGIPEIGAMSFSWIFKIMTALSSLVAAFALISIFFYKNRKRQILFCVIAFIFNVLLFGAMMLFSARLENVPIHMQSKITFFIPVIVMFLIIFATKAIRRDEATVKAADRLR